MGCFVSRESSRRARSGSGTVTRDGNREPTYKSEEVIEVAVRVDEEYL